MVSVAPVGHPRGLRSFLFQIPQYNTNVSRDKAVYKSCSLLSGHKLTCVPQRAAQGIDWI